MQQLKIFLFLGSLVLGGISFYQTAVGYEQMFGKVPAWAVSAVITLILIGINGLFIFNTSSKKSNKFPDNPEKTEQDKISVTRLVVTYCVAASVSFVGNFNGFYTQFMTKELYEYEIKSTLKATKATYEKAKGILDKPQDQATQLGREIESLSPTLRTEIFNEGDKGCGDECKKTLRIIQDKLNCPDFTIITTSNLQAIYDSLIIQIDAQIIKAKENMVLSSEKKKKDIEILYGNLDDAVGVALKPDNIESSAKAMIERCISINDGIANIMKGFVDFDYEKVEAKNTQIGKMSHSFASAWECMCVASVMVFVGSLFVDFFIPLLYWLLFGTSAVSKRRINANGDGILN